MRTHLHTVTARIVVRITKQLCAIGLQEGEEQQRVHHFKYLGLSMEETGGHDNRNFKESECSMGKLEEMQWSVV